MPEINPDEYTDWDQANGTHRRPRPGKAGQEKKRKLSPDEIARHQEVQRQKLIVALARDLKHFPPRDPTSQELIDMPTAKIQYQAWLMRSITIRFPDVDSEKDLFDDPREDNPVIQIHRVTGIGTWTERERGDDFRHDYSQPVLNRLASHVGNWLTLRKLTGSSFSLPILIDTVLAKRDELVTAEKSRPHLTSVATTTPHK